MFLCVEYLCAPSSEVIWSFEFVYRRVYEQLYIDCELLTVSFTAFCQHSLGGVFVDV